MSHYRGTRRRAQTRMPRSASAEMDLTPPTWLVALAAGATLAIGAAALYTVMEAAADDRRNRAHDHRRRLPSYN
jgi:hypothetical protein